MAKLEDILKADGWTDADIAAQATLLNDPKFRGAVEKSYGILETENVAYKAENQKWVDWHEKDGKELIALYEKERADAVALAGSLEARLKLAEKDGFAPRREDGTPNPNPNPNPGTPEPFDAKKAGVVTWEEAKRLMDAEGQAMALVHDLSAEYQHLTGKNLLDYGYTTNDGRQLRGMTALRAESMANKAPDIRTFAETKFGFQGHRDRIEAEAKAKAEAAIREDERNKVIGQYGNPNTRPLMPSNDPFIPAPREKDKQPWELSAQERTRARLERNIQTQMKGPVQ
jgi:hypothetical protein